MILTWDPVTVDCDGMAESPVVYLVRAAGRRVVGTMLNGDGNPQPVYAVTPWQEILETTVPGAVIVLNDPLLGEAILIDVEARDAAGKDSGACP